MHSVLRTVLACASSLTAAAAAAWLAEKRVLRQQCRRCQRRLCKRERRWPMIFRRRRRRHASVATQQCQLTACGVKHSTFNTVRQSPSSIVTSTPPHIKTAASRVEKRRRAELLFSDRQPQISHTTITGAQSLNLNSKFFQNKGFWA